MLTTIVLSMLIYQFYSSFIVSSLLTESPKIINTLRQLIDSRLKVGIEDITYNYDFFQTTNDKIALELFEKKIENNENFFDVNEGLKMMQQGGFAFHVDTSYAYRPINEMFTEEEICELNEMLLFPTRPLASSVAKDSPFKEFVTIGLQRLLENGIAAYHYKRWTAAKPKCVKSLSKIKSVDIGEVSTVFILLAFAFMTGFVVLMIEIVHFRLNFKQQAVILG